MFIIIIKDNKERKMELEFLVGMLCFKILRFSNLKVMNGMLKNLDKN